jgi:hypothetical protein
LANYAFVFFLWYGWILFVLPLPAVGASLAVLACLTRARLHPVAQRAVLVALSPVCAHAYGRLDGPGRGSWALGVGLAFALLAQLPPNARRGDAMGWRRFVVR